MNFRATIFSVCVASSAQAQTVITNPNDLEPENILELFQLAVPASFKEDLLSRKMSFFGFDVGHREYLILRERDGCDPSGCLHVVFNVNGNTLENPVFLFSNDAVWVDESKVDLSENRLCVSEQIMFVCNGE